MIDQIFANLSAFGSALYGTFVLPGEILFGWFALLSPAKADMLRLNNGEIIYPLILALIVWTLLIVLGLKLLRALRHFGRLCEAMIRTAIYHTNTQARNLRLSIIWKLRKLFPKRFEAAESTANDVELDEMDYAVLRCALQLGTSVSVSAPDLAKRLRIRPALARQSIEKLARHNMLGSEGRSWRGVESFRVTKAGDMFTGMMQRNERATSASHA